MNKLRIGLCQLNTQDSIDLSFKQIEHYTAECTERGAQLVVFPELSTYLSEIAAGEAAQTLDGEIISKFKNLAQNTKFIFITAVLLNNLN